MEAINIIAHTKNKVQTNTLKAFLKALKIKFEILRDEEYNPDFVAKIQESKKQYEQGKYIMIDKKEINQFFNEL